MRTAFAFLLLLSVGILAFGQDAGKPMFFETPRACTSAPEGTFMIYQPQYHEKLGWWKEMVSLGKAEHVQDSKARCAKEFTVVGWRIVRWPAGIGYFRQGDKIGDPRCGNPVEELWDVPEPTPEPTPAPPPPVEKKVHVCPTCGDVEWQGPVVWENDVMNVVLTSDLSLSLTASFRGHVSNVLWKDDAGEVRGEGNTVHLDRGDFARAGLYKLWVEGVDEDGHIIRCLVRIAATLPPAITAPASPLPEPVIAPKPKKSHKKLYIGIAVGAVGVACVVSAIEGWPVPCGWMAKRLAKKPKIITSIPK